MAIAKSIDCPAWKLIDEAELTELDVIKFEQHEDLRELLLSSNSRELIEATSDPFWGASVPLRSKALMNRTFNGQNRGGKVLMEARRILRERYPPPPQPVASPIVTTAPTTKDSFKRQRICSKEG